MKKGIHISVGIKGATITGDNNRVLQAAVDYVSGLGAEQFRFCPAPTR
jgi:hypothetical protein